jgi:hypothetical protein
MVYSSQEYALQCVADAIEKLDAKRRTADPGDLETQVADVWAMVGAMDPELAKVASRYASPA